MSGFSRPYVSYLIGGFGKEASLVIDGVSIGPMPAHMAEAALAAHQYQYVPAVSPPEMTAADLGLSNDRGEANHD